jgi:hypothetical protein
LSLVALKFVLDTDSVESVLARENVKLFVEDRLETNFTCLTWTYCDMLVFLFSLLNS